MRGGALAQIRRSAAALRASPRLPRARGGAEIKAMAVQKHMAVGYNYDAAIVMAATGQARTGLRWGRVAAVRCMSTDARDPSAAAVVQVASPADAAGTPSAAAAAAAAAEGKTGGGAAGDVAKWGSIYFELGKGKLSGLVTFTAAAGFVVATPLGAPMALPTLLATCAGTALSAMGASAFNQALESHNDSLMKRTARRPIVVGKISREHAFAAATAAGASGVALLYVAVNPLASALAASNIVLYAGIYTPLKQVSIWNTWVGAVVGAIPPMIGWAAVSNSIPMGAMALGGILFSWQMPHFLSLAYMMRADYKAGGYLMMPGDAGTASLKRATYACIRHCFYLEAMCVASAMPASMGGLELVSPIFAVEATVLNAAFLAASVMLHRAGQYEGSGKTNTAARRLFLASLAYLPLLLGAMCLHRCVTSDVPVGDAGSACPYKEANYLIKEAEKAEKAKGH